jgi:hypothetical protein
MKRTHKQIAHRRLPEDPKVLQEAIVLMESRLRRLGDGDCAYEKAMIRFYEQQLVLHRARLQLAPVFQEARPRGVSEGFSGRA